MAEANHLVNACVSYFHHCAIYVKIETKPRHLPKTVICPLLSQPFS
jgi:hypothetical protein